jgi:hypothetical protein
MKHQGVAMNSHTAACGAALVGALLVAGSGPAAAWASAGRFGGSTSHSWGSTTHDNRWGGSSTHVAGEGTSHSNVYGGGTAHSAYGGTEHTNMYGGSSYGAAGYGAYHTYPSGATYYHPPAYAHYPAYPVYHPPVPVPYYSSGCYGCAAAAGAIVGMTAGAAVASANSAAATSSAYSAGVATGSANTAAAYQSGYAAGATGSAALPGATTTTVTTTTVSYAMGATYAALPAGSMSIVKNGQTYYLNGNTWFLPAYGANGVHYTAVAAP